MKKIRLKELYLNTIDFSDPDYMNYNITRLLFDVSSFIFYYIRSQLEDGLFNFNKLYSFLNADVDKARWVQLEEQPTIQRCYIMDSMLINMYGRRLCNNLIDNFRYDYYPANKREVDFSVFAFDLSNIILNRFGDRWEKYITELEIEYNPVHNYNMTETKKINTDMSIDDTNDNNTFGFNTESEDGVPLNKNVYGRDIKGLAENNFEKIERSGNIGVTTNQKMLTDEIKVRDENVIIKRLLQDVADFITITVYE